MKRIVLSIVLTVMLSVASIARGKANPEPFNNWDKGIHLSMAIISNDNRSVVISQSDLFQYGTAEGNLAFRIHLKRSYSHHFALELDRNFDGMNISWQHKIVANPLVCYNSSLQQYGLNAYYFSGKLQTKNKIDRRFYWYAKLGICIHRRRANEVIVPDDKNEPRLAASPFKPIPPMKKERILNPFIG